MTVTFAWFEKQLDRLDAAVWPALQMVGHLPDYVQPPVCPLRTVFMKRDALYAQYRHAFDMAGFVDRRQLGELTIAAYPPRLAAYLTRTTQLPA
jgi:hypothetical protein